jgi:N-acetylmuramoyl-L-alanine amidase
MKIGIDMGHPINCGAFGIMSETDGNRAVGKLLIEKLKALGHIVVNCTYDTNVNELANRVALANAQKLDYFISLHMDCFDNASANGVTIYTTESSSAKTKAIDIVNSVANSCGYNNRGWKSANFYVLKNTNAPAMLLEMGFVSSKLDCDKFNAEKIANAVVTALTGQVVSNTEEKVYVVSDYLAKDKNGYLDINYVLSYFNGIKCYFKSDDKGIWIVTDWITKSQAEQLKTTLGSWYYDTRK